MVIGGDRAWREGSEREESRMMLACVTDWWMVVSLVGKEDTGG